MPFAWTDFLDEKSSSIPGLSDYIVSSTGCIGAMVGKHFRLLTRFDPNQGAFEDLVKLIWPAGRPNLGLKALEPAADIGSRRYRVSFCKTERGEEMTLRLLPNVIRTPEELRVPAPVVEMFERPEGGLYLFSGNMGSGKSSTMSALCMHLAERSSHRFMTIEDPVEFMYPEVHGGSYFAMRGIGTACLSYEMGVEEVRRQHATVVVAGEIRNRMTAEVCLRLALIGLKVMATIHGENVPATAAAFAAECGEDGAFWARMNLAQACRMMLSQRLIRNSETGGLVAIHEVLFNTPREHTSVAATLREGRFEKLRHEIQNHRRSGMQTFEDSLNDACNDGILPNEMRPNANFL